jgi:MFS family permease
VFASSNAIGPRLLGPLFGERNVIRYGLLAFAASLVAMGLSPTGPCFVASVLCSSIATMCLPCITGVISREAHEEESGATMAALDQLGTLDRLVAYKGMSRLFAWGIGAGQPGAHFYAGALCVVVGWAVFELGESLAAKRDRAAAAMPIG